MPKIAIIYKFVKVILFSAIGSAFLISTLFAIFGAIEGTKYIYIEDQFISGLVIFPILALLANLVFALPMHILLLKIDKLTFINAIISGAMIGFLCLDLWFNDWGKDFIFPFTIFGTIHASIYYLFAIK